MQDLIDGSDELRFISKAQFRSARRLLERKVRIAERRFLAEGTQAVREALLHGAPVEKLLVVDPIKHGQLLAHSGDIPIELVTKDQAAQLAKTVNSQDIWAIVADIELSLDQLAEKLVAPKLVVVCAQVRDPGNAGTVIRCADAFGADAVIMTKDSVELTNPKTVRASVGSIFHLPIATGADYAETMDWLGELGLQRLAADMSGYSLSDADQAGDLAKPTAWVMGNEAWGLPEAALAKVDQVVSVPMWGKAESLNISTAAAVCLYASANAQHRKS